MSRPSVIPLLILVFAVSPHRLPGQTANRPPKQVVLMRNGNHLEGTVRERDKGYLVTLEGGGEIYLPSDRVELVAPSLEHVYLLKRAAIRKGAVRDQLDMTEWCLRNRLLSYAADHLLTAMTLAPDHAKLPALEHRLRTAAEQAAADREREQVAAAPKAPESPEQNVAGAVFEPGDLPPGTLEMFTNFVQPVLLNRCSSAACHGGNSPSEFQLQKPGMGELISRKITLHNLQAALKLVDQDAPRNSPLLVTPIGPHADLGQGLFASHELGQLKRLASWVHVAAGHRNIHTAAFVEQPDQQLMQRLPESPDAFRSIRGRDFPAGTPSPDRLDLPQDNENRPPSPDEGFREPGRFNAVDGRPIGAERASPDAARQDPFDPAVFNRRHHSSAPGSRSENSPR